jgi:hypothetical protein
VAAQFPELAASASAVCDNTSERRSEMGKFVISENVTLDGDGDCTGVAARADRPITRRITDLGDHPAGNANQAVMCR